MTDNTHADEMISALVASADFLLEAVLHELDCLAALRRLSDAGCAALVELDRLAREPQAAHLEIDMQVIRRLRTALSMAAMVAQPEGEEG